MQRDRSQSHNSDVRVPRVNSGRTGNQVTQVSNGQVGHGEGGVELKLGQKESVEVILVSQDEQEALD